MSGVKDRLAEGARQTNTRVPEPADESRFEPVAAGNGSFASPERRIEATPEVKDRGVELYHPGRSRGSW